MTASLSYQLLVWSDCRKKIIPLGTRSEKKRDYVGKIPKWRTPPPSLVQKFELGHIYTSINHVHFMVVVRRKKMGLCGNSLVADLPPQFGKPLLSKKKLGLFFILEPQEHFWSSPKNHNYKIILI